MSKAKPITQSKIGFSPQYSIPFLLYPQHANFIPGQSALKFETLPTTIKTMWGCVGDLIIVFLCVLLGAAFFASGISQMIDEHRFLNEGHEIAAEIQRCDVQNSKNGSYLTITYIYRIDNMPYLSENSVSGSNCDFYPVGGVIPALYLPSDLEWSTLSKKSDLGGFGHDVALACFIPAIIFMTPFLAILVIGVEIKDYGHARQMYPRLQMDGIILPGKITTISSRNTSKLGDGKFLVKVEYEFQTPQKILLKGLGEAHRQDLRHRTLPPAGTPIIVLYADDQAYMML